MTDHELMWNFESLGHDCELGLLQRQFKAEPAGLLRWGGTHVVHLIRGLEDAFQGLADEAELELIGQEYYFKDRIYGIGRHTGAFSTYGVDPGRLLERQRMQVRLLRRNFLEGLVAGSKVYVFKDFERASHNIVRRLGQALRLYGPNRLLFVHSQDQRGARPKLEQLADGIWYGQLDKFGNAPSGWDISTDAWLELMRGVLRSQEL